MCFLWFRFSFISDFSNVRRLNHKQLAEPGRGNGNTALCFDEFFREDDLFISGLQCVPSVGAEHGANILGRNSGNMESWLEHFSGQRGDFRGHRVAELRQTE
jgi:hypothetical protein